MEEPEFVQDPPEEYLCIVCSKILHEPHLTDCCGQHFCQVCLEQWFERQQKKICPHCRSESFNYIRSLPIKRKIEALEVYCSNRAKGCSVIMTLSERSLHNIRCGYALVICSQGCGELILRKDMKEHSSNVCSKRMIMCKYCHRVDHFEVINGEHTNICEEFPVICPKGCDQELIMKRKDVPIHGQVCPLEQVQCPFYDAGCELLILRKDLSGHMESNIQQHLLTMMAAYCSLETKHNKLSDEHNQLSKAHKLLSEEHKQLSKEHKLLLDEHKQLSVKVASLPGPILVEEASATCSASSSPEPSSAEGWSSPCFYVLNGYKMRVVNECYAGNRAALFLLKGEHDDNLEWPMDLGCNVEIAFERRSTRRNVQLPFIPEHFILSSRKFSRVTLHESEELGKVRIPKGIITSIMISLKHRFDINSRPFHVQF